MTIACGGGCVEAEAVARGGHPPYTYTWEDGSHDARRRLCASADTKFSVMVTDTTQLSEEFPYRAQTVSASVSAVLLGCGGPFKSCDLRLPADDVKPEVKWTFPVNSTTTPLVANLTDDNGDGTLDDLDTPDVLVLGMQSAFVLDGATGTEHYRVSADEAQTPAIGDLDGDGRADLVVVSGGGLRAYRHDGSKLWRGDGAVFSSRAIEYTSASIADLDHDGSPEIMVGNSTFDARGKLLWRAARGRVGSATTPIAADLDGDGMLEVVWGAVAYRHDGTEYYRNTEIRDAAVDAHKPRYLPAVADLDGDGRPEVIVASSSIFVLDHTGRTLRRASCGAYPATAPSVQDLDGDGTPEILVSNGWQYMAFDAELQQLWSAVVDDHSAAAASAAFDFHGDGTAEGVYADHGMLGIFDGLDGHLVFSHPRFSATLIERPTVADVDGDGSADILVTSTRSDIGLVLISHPWRRWVPARRIMNQDAYHVTNVNDDGTIPRHPAPSWLRNNTFRAQAQVNVNGTVCLPEPE